MPKFSARIPRKGPAAIVAKDSVKKAVAADTPSFRHLANKSPRQPAKSNTLSPTGPDGPNVRKKIVKIRWLNQL